MLKKNKRNLTLSTMVILLPAVVGLVLWNRLPEQMPTHWNIAGEIDGWSSKLFGVVGMPVFLMAVHLACLFATRTDPKNKGHNEKLLGLVLWICPAISILCSAVTYCTALGLTLRVERIFPPVIGLMFVVLGNFMPKFKQNHTMGIRLPWTLADKENWNKTHRLGGILWVAAGVFIIVSGVLGWTWMVLLCLIPATLIPIVYSYCLCRKKHSCE